MVDDGSGAGAGPINLDEHLPCLKHTCFTDHAFWSTPGGTEASGQVASYKELAKTLSKVTQHAFGQLDGSVAPAKEASAADLRRWRRLSSEVAVSRTGQLRQQAVHSAVPGSAEDLVFRWPLFHWQSGWSVRGREGSRCLRRGGKSFCKSFRKAIAAPNCCEFPGGVLVAFDLRPLF